MIKLKKFYKNQSTPLIFLSEAAFSEKAPKPPLWGGFGGSKTPPKPPPEGPKRAPRGPRGPQKGGWKRRSRIGKCDFWQIYPLLWNIKKSGFWPGSKKGRLKFGHPGLPIRNLKKASKFSGKCLSEGGPFSASKSPPRRGGPKTPFWGVLEAIFGPPKGGGQKWPPESPSGGGFWGHFDLKMIDLKKS